MRSFPATRNIVNVLSSESEGRFAQPQQVVRGDIVVIRRAAEKIEPAFAYAVFVMGEQRLRDSESCGGFLLAQPLFFSE